MPDLLGSTLGPYRILEQIGLGGMATVYKAYQPGMDRLVALKVLPHHYARDPRFIKRFEQEARVIAKLEHRNIVPVYDFGEQDGTAYLAMRYLQAGTVKEILSHGPLPLSDAAKLLNDIAAALDYAHSQGIIHRDVKPSNVLVDKQGNAYLTDFGIAKVIESTMEMTGSAALGTPAYMAPEQTLGKAVTPQSDVYSLGVMLYEMVTGKPPFEADTPMAIALMHVHEPLPLPRKVKADLPEAVELVVLKALAKEVKDRYQSAGEVARAFGEAVGAEAVTTSTRLVELASVTATGKGGEEVTYDIREEMRKRERTERTRKVLLWSPWVVGGLVIVGLVVGLFLARSETEQVRSASIQTATVVANLFGQLALAQTAVAGGGAEYEPTVQYLQTQMAVAGVNNVGNFGTASAEPTMTSTISASPTFIDSGGQIAFISDREGGSQVFVMNSDGSNVTQLTDSDGNKWDPAWSPDGRKLAFVWAFNIYTMNAVGSEVDLLTITYSSPIWFERYGPAWSPDGQQIVYAFKCGDDPACGEPGTYLMDADGSRNTRLAPYGLSIWSPSGQQIIYVGNEGSVFSMNADGSNRRLIDGAPQRITRMAWSPDGQKIAYEKSTDVYVMNPDGSGQAQLTFGGGNSFPAWSPDSRTIAFCSQQDGNYEVYVMNADGSKQVNLTSNPANDCSDGLAWGGQRQPLTAEDTSTPTQKSNATTTQTPGITPSPTATPRLGESHILVSTSGCVLPRQIRPGVIIFNVRLEGWSTEAEARAAVGDSLPQSTGAGASIRRGPSQNPTTGLWGYDADMQRDYLDPNTYQVTIEWLHLNVVCGFTVESPQ